jgi:uncharacterized protein with FMN-binding domain
MRRAPLVITGTAAGLAAVLSFKPHKPEVSAAATPVATATSTATATATKASSSGTKTASGAFEDTRYGPVQVRVTVSGGKITKVEALQLPQNDPRSSEISSWAEPQLRASALSKQSASIDAVSGATFTSEGYQASLQSALDKIGFSG